MPLNILRDEASYTRTLNRICVSPMRTRNLTQRSNTGMNAVAPFTFRLWGFEGIEGFSLECCGARIDLGR